MWYIATSTAWSIHFVDWRHEARLRLGPSSLRGPVHFVVPFTSWSRSLRGPGSLRGPVYFVVPFTA